MSKKDYITINQNKSFSLADVSTALPPRYPSAKEYKKPLKKNRVKLKEFQTMLYANHAKSMLIVFQGMDTSGKDGAISHILSGLNPQGCNVVSFKVPSSVELAHDFFWRVNRELPKRGEIGIFNRSYYEEVLVTRVHPELILAEQVPGRSKPDQKFWDFRYQDMVNHEMYLHRQGYEIVKIFIHISKAEQKLRLLDRFSNPKKTWKISEGDIRERAYWQEYQEAYGECIAATASERCPWYIVPGDDKPSARLMISQIIIDRFRAMNLSYPKLSAGEDKALKSLLAELKNE